MVGNLHEEPAILPIEILRVPAFNAHKAMVGPHALDQFRRSFERWRAVSARIVCPAVVKDEASCSTSFVISLDLPREFVDNSHRPSLFPVWRNRIPEDWKHPH